MNVTKALLCINDVNVTNISHGIIQSRYSKNTSNSLEKVEVTFLGNSVLNEFSRYLGEDVEKKTYKILRIYYIIFHVFIESILLRMQVHQNFLFLVTTLDLYVRILLRRGGENSVLIQDMLMEQG